MIDHGLRLDCTIKIMNYSQIWQQIVNIICFNILRVGKYLTFMLFMCNVYPLIFLLVKYLFEKAYNKRLMQKNQR